jgi:hypothetical protein
VAKFESLVANLSRATGLDQALILQQAMITPSCGTGSLPIPDAERVFSILGQTSKLLREKVA